MAQFIHILPAWPAFQWNAERVGANLALAPAPEARVGQVGEVTADLYAVPDPAAFSPNRSSLSLPPWGPALPPPPPSNP